MVTVEEADKIALKVANEYIDECGCAGPQDTANALTKLTSLCGVMMVLAVGYEEGVARMQGTTNFIRREMENYVPPTAH